MICSGRFRALRARGFTLLEVLAIILVVAVTSAIAVPSIMGAMSERRARESADEVLLLARLARGEAAGYARAYVLRWSDANNGTFRLYRGRASQCNATANNWVAITASNCAAANPQMCRGEILASSFQTGTMDVIMSESTGRGLLDVCFEPNGRVLWRDNVANRFSDRNTVGGGFQFRFQRREDGTVTGVARTVVVPLGGDPRILR